MTSWELPVVLVGLVLFVLLGSSRPCAAPAVPLICGLMDVSCLAHAWQGCYLYWRTSDEYRVYTVKKKLGYDVKSPFYVFTYVFGICIGPILRKRWNKEHEFFSNTEYESASVDDGNAAHNNACNYSRCKTGAR